jgi:hypothetical protein
MIVGLKKPKQLDNNIFIVLMNVSVQFILKLNIFLCLA